VAIFTKCWVSRTLVNIDTGIAITPETSITGTLKQTHTPQTFTYTLLKLHTSSWLDELGMDHQLQGRKINMALPKFYGLYTEIIKILHLPA
jgi:hypothetical protein